MQRWFVMLMTMMGVGILMMPTTPTQAQESDTRPILWMLNTGLWLDDTELGITNVFDASLSPDGTHIAYTTSDFDIETGATLVPELVLFNIADEQVVQRVRSSELPTHESGMLQFSAPQWLDNEQVLFNTLAVLQGPGGVLNLGDLWGYGLDGVLAQHLARGDGGFFTLSPDRQVMALSRPGRYRDDSQPGSLQLFSTTNFTALNDAFTFTAVATGSEVPWVPAVYWHENSQQIAFAIIDADLAYATPPGIPASQLCTMTVNETMCQDTTLSFPARVVWSSTLENVAFQRAVGVNEWQIHIVAGENDTVLQPQFGLQEPLFWSGDDLLLRHYGVEAVRYSWVESEVTIPFEANVLNVAALTDGSFVLGVGTFQSFTVMRYDHMSGASTEIARGENGIPQFGNS